MPLAGSGTFAVGIGYDVHAMAQNRKLVIGGVEIPYKMGLAGHSDADVLAHAIADAVLGAARCNDIGHYFSPDDPKFLNADSMFLLSEVANIVGDAGWKIADVDSVVVAQEPRISPYRDDMRQNIAKALGISVESVGVKATTTEHLGFEGRKEGISAQAVALLERI